MNQGLERRGGRVAARWLAGIVCVFGMAKFAEAQEEVPCPPPIGGRLLPILTHLRELPSAGEYLHRVVANDHGDIVIYLTRLPQPGSLLEQACPGQTCCEEMLERLGRCDSLGGGLPHVGEVHARQAGEFPHARQTVVFDRVTLRPGQIVDTREVRASGRRLKAELRSAETCEAGSDHCTASFLQLGCPCGAVGQCACATKADSAGTCAAAGCAGCQCDVCGCPDCQCDDCPGKSAEVRCGEECSLAMMVQAEHPSHGLEADHHPLRLMEHIASLMAEKAAAEAALEVRQEAAEQISELFEAMAEIMADNAALDARLESQAEHTKLVAKMAELVGENARLKAHVELAAERAELQQNTLSLTLENERLKLRLANLEERHAESEAARTAARRHAESTTR